MFPTPFDSKDNFVAKTPVVGGANGPHLTEAFGALVCDGIEGVACDGCDGNEGVAFDGCDGIEVAAFDGFDGIEGVEFGVFDGNEGVAFKGCDGMEGVAFFFSSGSCSILGFCENVLLLR